MTAKASRILLLHPGEMGHALGRALVSAEHRVSWVSAGRSDATGKRAEAAGLVAVASLGEGLAGADIVLSVCPPDAAEAQAAAVAAAGYRRAYVDANAVAPQTVRRIGETLSKTGITMTDAGIVGPPPHVAGTTRFYVSGPDADAVAGLFAGTVVEAIPVGAEVGAASAVKMSYAAWTKGTTALFIAVRALARAEGIEEALLAEWRRSQPALVKRDPSASIAKAWRFAGEMNEVSRTFGADGLPTGFHEAAAELYDALAPFKDKWDVTLEEALALLAEKPGA